MARLSLTDSQPVAMIADNPAEAADIVYKACQCDIGFRTDYSNSPDKQTVHALPHEAEDMLRTDADFGLLPVAGFLNLRQRTVPALFSRIWQVSFRIPLSRHRFQKSSLPLSYTETGS